LKSFLLNVWETLHSSYWFVPTLMTVGAVCLSYGLLALDRHLHLSPTGVAWLYSGGASGARSVLSTIASSVITVAGTTFSITIAALSLASSQFGPRLLRGFLRDTGNQIVLGTFIGTFVYCLLVLRVIRGEEHDVFVPNLAVSGGVFLSLASVAVLIYFINHVSASIQAAQVIDSVTGELNEAIDRLYPTHIGQGVEDIGPPRPEHHPRPARPVFARKSGYVQIVNQERLIHLAREAGGVLELTHNPGEFVTQGGVLAVLRSDAGLSEKARSRINDAFVLGPHRTMTQDAQFGVDQLVEVGVRALSPGINDPFTAMMCLDRLGESLARLARRPVPSPFRYDTDGALRVTAQSPSFADMAEAAFSPIRRNGNESFALLRHLLATLEAITPHVRFADRAVLRRQVELINAGRGALSEAEDRVVIASRCTQTLRMLETVPPADLEPSTEA
jgi:uncharacterized membrane protein